MIKTTRNTRKPAGGVYLASIILLLASIACINIPLGFRSPDTPVPPPQRESQPPSQAETQVIIPTLTAQPPLAGTAPPGDDPAAETPRPPLEEPDQDLFISQEMYLAHLFENVNPGVVSVKVYIGQGIEPSGTGSGFVLDEEGHIITNRHVVARTALTTVVFYNGLELEVSIVGMDIDSDLAVLKVDQLPEGVYPLPLGDSNAVLVGEPVVAIGNPFGQANSMTRGIVSAVGRAIPTGVTPFRIPQAIQTDAAINPGNSGGPLLNLRGEVIGVNAQIATAGGVAASAGVGFAIPSNTVRRVAPVLIETGIYQWPYLGVSGLDVSLPVQMANDLPFMRGYMIVSIVEGSPADRAGLRGSAGSATVAGLSQIPVGGDIIIMADGVEIIDLTDLLVVIASHAPGETMDLVIYRDGQEQQVSVVLDPRRNDSNNDE